MSTESEGVAAVGRGLWRLESRNDILFLGALLALVPFLPKQVPLGVYGLGVVTGSALSLQVLAIVLVYRSNRIINFAQVAVGSAAVTVFSASVTYRPLLRWTDFMCSGTCEGPLAVQVNYWLSFVISLGLAILFGWIVYMGVIRRFSNAPRLVLTVATIFVQRILVTDVSRGLPNLLSTANQREDLSTLARERTELPFDFVLELNPAKFHASDILTVIVAFAAMVGLFAYLRYSPMGTAIRASAENATRAKTLGINVNKVTSRVWILAAALSGVAALLAATAQGGTVAPAGFGVPTLVLALAAAVIARLVSLPMALAASLVLGIFQQGMLWSFSTSAAFDGALVFIMCGALLLRRRRQTSRAEDEQASAWRSSREIRPIPTELRGLPTVQKWLRWGITAASVVVVGGPWVMSPRQNTVAAALMLYAMIGLSLLVLTGWAGQISLGQFAFAAVGGYVAAMSHLPFLVALVAGAVVGAVVALLVGFPALKLPGLYLAVTSLAFALFVHEVVLNPRYLGKNLPALQRPSLIGMNLDDDRIFYYFTLLVLVLVTFAVLGLRRSRTARALIAGRDNERAAQTFGTDLVRARLAAFSVSGFIAALAGALLAYHQHGVAGSAFLPERSLDIFRVTIIGGLGAISGPILGQLYNGMPGLIGIPSFVGSLLAGVGALGILLLVPGGLAQTLSEGRDSMLRRVAKRNHLIVPSLIADMKAQDGDDLAPLAPNTRPGGGAAFVPSRYRLRGQWALHVPDVDSKQSREAGQTVG